MLIDPATSQTHVQTIGNTVSTLSWAKSIVTTDITIVPDQCLPLVFEIWDVTTLSEVAIDASILTINLASDPQTLQITSTDLSQAAVFSLRYKVYYTGYSTETTAT